MTLLKTILHIYCQHLRTPCNLRTFLETSVSCARVSRRHFAALQPQDDRHRSDLPSEHRKPSEKFKENAKTTSYTLFIIGGLGVTGFIFYSIFRELFSSNSANGIFKRAFDKCLESTRVQDLLGMPIKGFGEENRRGRRRHTRHLEYVDSEDGLKHMRMEFHLKGTRNTATAHLEMKADPSGNYDYRYLFVQVEDWPREMGSFLSTDPKAEQLAAVGTACVIAVCGVVYLMRNRVMPLPPVVVPSQWKKVAEVSALYLYPVKSGRAREVDSAECTKMGLKHGAYRDRFFMLVSEEGELVSGRLYPAVVLLRLEIDGSQLTLRCTGQEDLTVNVDNYHERREATVHGTKFNARCMGMAVSDWLTSAFVPYEEDRRRRIFLVFHDQTSTQRLVETSKFQDLLRPTDGPFFADAVPYLLCSESSVADLQEKIRQNGAKFVDSEPEVQVLDFRPNIVVRQSADGPPLQPFDEDNWLWIRFGEGGPIFRKGGDCTRCKFTTVSHEHGVQRRSAEPLISMKKYRQFDDPEAKKWSKFKSRFGAYYAAEVEGSVSVGDSVYLGYSS